MRSTAPSAIDRFVLDSTQSGPSAPNLAADFAHLARPARSIRRHVFLPERFGFSGWARPGRLRNRLMSAIPAPRMTSGAFEATNVRGRFGQVDVGVFGG
jgi:hypothetical protein